MKADHAVVYVIEDDPETGGTLAAILSDAGLEARVWRSAEDFLSGAALDEPICLLTNVRLPGLSGLELYKELARRGVDTAVVMMTGEGDLPMAVAAMKSGALDFIEKPVGAGVLIRTILHALKRTSELRAARKVRSEFDDCYATLTEREREILALLVEGLSNKLIARRLAISVRTAEHHHANILRKMNAPTTFQLVKAMLETQTLRAGDPLHGARPAIPQSVDRRRQTES